MPTITVPRPDGAHGEVSEARRQGLGPRYNVLPGKGMNWNPVGNPRADQPDKVVVGTGSTRLFRAEGSISRASRRTGLPNRLWAAEKVRRVLQAAPSLR